MAATGYAWKGTTLTLGSAVTGLLSCRANKSADQLDITDADSDQKEFETGYSDSEVTFQVKGATPLEVGYSGNLSILWGATGVTVNYGMYTVTAVSINGDRGSIVTSDITCKPAIAAAGGGS